MRGNIFVGWTRNLLGICLLAGLIGCGSDPTDPEDPDPEVVPTISGMLSRIHGAGEGTSFQDEFLFWVDEEKMDSTDRLRLGSVLDETSEPGDPDGYEFRLFPGLDVPLFTAGQNIAVELLFEGGGVRGTAFCEGPSADLAILSPATDEAVSLAGFSVQWRSDGQGTANIELLSEVDGTSWEIMTDDDGVYQISADDLAGFPKGACRIQVIGESATSLSSVELGVGTMTYLMTGIVTVIFGN